MSPVPHQSRSAPPAICFKYGCVPLPLDDCELFKQRSTPFSQPTLRRIAPITCPSSSTTCPSLYVCSILRSLPRCVSCWHDSEAPTRLGWSSQELPGIGFRPTGNQLPTALRRASRFSVRVCVSRLRVHIKTVRPLRPARPQVFRSLPASLMARSPRPPTRPGLTTFGTPYPNLPFSAPIQQPSMPCEELPPAPQ